MTTIQIENLPDELYTCIQNLAAKNQLTLNEAVIHLLQQALQPNELKVIQEQQTQPMSEILQKIRSRPKVNPINFGSHFQRKIYIPQRCRSWRVSRSFAGRTPCV